MLCGRDEILCNPSYLEAGLSIGRIKWRDFHTISTNLVKKYGADRGFRDPFSASRQALEKAQQTEALDRIRDERQDKNENDENAQEPPLQVERCLFVQDGGVSQAKFELEIKKQDHGAEYQPARPEKESHEGQESDHHPGDEVRSSSQNGIG